MVDESDWAVVTLETMYSNLHYEQITFIFQALLRASQKSVQNLNITTKDKTTSTHLNELFINTPLGAITITYFKADNTLSKSKHTIRCKQPDQSTSHPDKFPPSYLDKSEILTNVNKITNSYRKLFGNLSYDKFQVSRARYRADCSAGFAPINLASSPNPSSRRESTNPNPNPNRTV